MLKIDGVAKVTCCRRAGKGKDRLWRGGGGTKNTNRVVDSRAKNAVSREGLAGCMKRLVVKVGEAKADAAWLRNARLGEGIVKRLAERVAQDSRAH